MFSFPFLDAIMDGRVTTVTSVFHTLAVSMGVASYHGSASVRLTGVASYAIKV